MTETLSINSADTAARPDVHALLRDFGSPLFIVSEAALRGGYRNFHAAFAAVDLHPRIAYSYKTNYLPAVCAILHQEGAGAEVVSGMEYALARSLGVAADSIVFNGPGKAHGELKAALRDGALVVIDGFDELEAAAEIARGMQAATGRKARIGLRIDLGLTGEWSRFGFAKHDMARALARVAQTPALSLELLHHHAGIDHRDPAPYARAAAELLRFSREARDFGHQPQAIDIGGGFPSNLPLQPFAEAVAGVFAMEDGADLVAEPGRVLVDPAVHLACTVMAAKEIPGGGRAVVTDAGVNVLSNMCRRVARPLSAVGVEGAPVPTGVFGPLCMPEDRLAEAALLPPLKPGDVLMVAEAGAYTLSQATEFSQPRPAAVLVGPAGVELIREREDWHDVIAPAILPERLRAAGAAKWPPPPLGR